jgi:hypothetical protein
MPDNKKRSNAWEGEGMREFFNKYLLDIHYCGLGFSSFPKMFDSKGEWGRGVKRKIEKYFIFIHLGLGSGEYRKDILTAYILKPEYWADYPDFWETQFYNRNSNKDT